MRQVRNKHLGNEVFFIVVRCVSLPGHKELKLTNQN